ncbi:hypothetical protein [Weeksella virosa]|uniref:Uncharacterized protein n=1 Tax=Weeksella virosa (strain ATCC 43766 / DSM 16922 / JCM 21250 / CCUG 30538 / CDC 9751 / IAM 14551 / NBRC 16016 / NCTC 11634 / CL345/78) TaxID=865938 RepID=F0P2W7_WEEVC|nr:hypothetical protein [Weeksella virosa]ADX66857.1 hypothetical protein Weevi_0131 [Weeksella virosa DSM 16922]MDK7675081.1 hypothetical protein [Weeksella virosa]VEH63419.1 Uncharacterised protein [Weeksella virosa]
MSKKKEDLIYNEGAVEARSRAQVNLERAKKVEAKRIQNGARYVKIDKGYKLVKDG